MGLTKLVFLQPSSFAFLFIKFENSLTLPETCSAKAIAASLAEGIKSTFNKFSTVNISPAWISALV